MAASSDRFMIDLQSNGKSLSLETGEWPAFCDAMVLKFASSTKMWVVGTEAGIEIRMGHPPV
jgi:hypothetical protein